MGADCSRDLRDDIQRQAASTNCGHEASVLCQGLQYEKAGMAVPGRIGFSRWVSRVYRHSLLATSPKARAI